jgi:hypothetical protein
MNTYSSRPIARGTLYAALLGVATIPLQASTDYGPAVWRPVCSGKWNTSGTGHRFYVEHDMEGYYLSSISYMQKCSVSVSVHYACNGKQDASSDAAAGQLSQLVRDAYYAWHARCWNGYSLGTEHEGFASSPAWYTTAMYNASGTLTQSKCNKYGIAKDRNHVIAHGQKGFSGWTSWAQSAGYSYSWATCNTHTDPGPYWNWTTFMNVVKGTAATPSAPSTLAVAVVSTTQLKLTWKDNSGIETGTKIERSTAATSGFTQIATVGANVVTYTASGLASGTRYYFRVRAYNAAGNSGYSNTGNNTTKDTIPAGATGLTATATSSAQINLAWACAAGNEDGFKIYRSTDGTTFAQVATAGINATTYANTGLAPNTLYYYRVYSYNTAGNSAVSNTASDTTAPNPPSALTAVSQGSGPTTWDKVNLSWTDNANSEVGFKIERSPDNVTFTQIATNAAGVTTYSDAGLAAQHAYWYRVRSYNANGNSVYSNVATLTTPNAPPVLAAIGEKSVAPNGTLTFTATATDPNKVVTTTTFATFEGTADGTQEQMFNKPANSSTTIGFIDTAATNYSMIKTGLPAGATSTKAVKVGWSFKTTAATNYWVRLNSFTTPTWPNPTVALDQIVRFKIYSSKALKVGVGLRETSTTAAYGADGGTTGTLEWVGVTNVVSGNPIPNKLLPANTWTTLSYNIPFEPQAAFTGDGKVLQSGVKGVLEEIILKGEGGTGAYTVWIDDLAVVAQNTLAYTLDSGAPAGASIERRTGLFTWTPTAAQVGAWNITVRVTDQGGAQDFETIRVTVLSAGNNAPVLAAIGAKTAKEGTALTFTASATEVDPGQTKTFSLDAGAPAGATINSSTGAFSWTPTEAQGPGSYPITVRVTDNGTPVSNDFETITVTVSEVNAAPALAAIAPQSVNEGSTLTVAASATDSDVPVNSVSYSLEPGAPAGMTINSSTGVISWTPGESSGPDVIPVTVRATDNGSPVLFTRQSFTVTVNEVNVAPVLTLGTTMTSGDVIADFEGEDPDSANGSVMFRPPIYSGSSSAFIDGVIPNFTEVLNTTNYPDFDINTSAQVLHATWGFKTGTTNPWVRLLTFTNPSYTNTYSTPNPTIDLGQRVRFKIYSDKSIKIGLGVRETGTAVPNGFNGGTTGAIEWVGITSSVNGQPQCTRTVSASNWTTLEFNLPVEPALSFASGNGVLATGKGVLEHLAIVPNGGMGAYNVYLDDFQVVSISTNLTINTLDVITVTNSATDADVPANVLTFSLGGTAPAGAEIDPITGVFTWAPSAAQSGMTWDIPITVTDDGAPALSDTKNLHVVVNKVNTPPQISGVPDQVIEASSGQTVTFTASAQDDDLPANTLTYSLTGAVPAGATINSTTGDFTWTPPAGNSTNVFAVRVTDNGLPPLFDEQSVSIMVLPVNTAPTLSLGTARMTESVISFETFTNNTPTEQVMFKKPFNSSTTTNYIDTTATNYTTVTTVFPAGNTKAGAKVMKVGWSFKTGQVDQWVRLNTLNAALLPNPTINASAHLKFDVYSTKALKMGLGIRETGTTAENGANGGTTGAVEYVGCASKNGSTPIPTRTVNSNTWTTLEFDLPNEPVQTLTGDGILASGQQVLEHLVVYGAGGAGAYTMYVDNFEVVTTASLPGTVNMKANSTLTFTASATDPDPGAGFGFGTDADFQEAFPGAVMDPVTGAFTWTPGSSEAGTTNSVIVTAEDSPTNGAFPKSDSKTVTVVVSADTLGAQSSTVADATTLSWDSIAGTSYKVQSQGADGLWTDLKTVQATGSVTNAQVAGGTAYRVVTLDESAGQ